MTVIYGQIETLKTIHQTLKKAGLKKDYSIEELLQLESSYEQKALEIKSNAEKKIQDKIIEKRKKVDQLMDQFFAKRATAKKIFDQKVAEQVNKYKILDERKAYLFLFLNYAIRKYFIALRVKELKDSEDEIIDHGIRVYKKEHEESYQELTQLEKSKKALIDEEIKYQADSEFYLFNLIRELKPTILGAIGEEKVVEELQKLNNEYVLINDFQLSFNPPIHSTEYGKILSVQLDHILVGPSGIFLLETKNWSQQSINTLDLRSPVEQISRTSYALFILLNNAISKRHIKLEDHHWGDKTIKLKNIIVMINEKPAEEFKFVKVKKLNELVGYINYFDEVYKPKEVGSIVKYLRHMNEH